MGTIKAWEIQHSDILKLESEMNNLWGELNTSNIPQTRRIELEEQLTQCEEDFRKVLGGQASYKDLEAHLRRCDMELAQAVLNKAETEIPKGERMSSNFLALENIRQKMEEGKLTPIRTRHEIKTLMRHRHG